MPEGWSLPRTEVFDSGLRILVVSLTEQLLSLIYLDAPGQLRQFAGLNEERQFSAAKRYHRVSAIADGGVQMLSSVALAAATSSPIRANEKP